MNKPAIVSHITGNLWIPNEWTEEILYERWTQSHVKWYSWTVNLSENNFQSDCLSYQQFKVEKIILNLSKVKGNKHISMLASHIYNATKRFHPSVYNPLLYLSRMVENVYDKFFLMHMIRIKRNLYFRQWAAAAACYKVCNGENRKWKRKINTKIALKKWVSFNWKCLWVCMYRVLVIYFVMLVRILS